ncbi:MAG: multiheme c-type cytochrome, partial [Planctomycetota bacterium]
MKKLGLGFCLSAVMALTSMAWAAEQPQKKETPPDLYEGTPDWYRAVYKDNVGLKEGSGPFKDYFKPQMLDMYWQPNRHYEPMKNLDHSLFIEKERRDLCVTCHEEATPGVVSDWRSSGHKNPKSTPYLSARTAEIEKRTNRVLNEVHCFDCHADTKTKQIRMPTGEVCGECHRPQFDDFLREREVGRPNHIQSWEANTIVPWYAEAARRGYLYGQHGCDHCHSGAEKCDV